MDNLSVDLEIIYLAVARLQADMKALRAEVAALRRDLVRDAEREASLTSPGVVPWEAKPLEQAIREGMERALASDERGTWAGMNALAITIEDDDVAPPRLTVPPGYAVRYRGRRYTAAAPLGKPIEGVEPSPPTGVLRTITVVDEQT